MKPHRRKYYKETGFEIPREYHIHHLNRNQKDNNISNLVAIPASIHLAYHYTLTVIKQQLEWMIQFRNNEGWEWENIWESKGEYNLNKYVLRYFKELKKKYEYEYEIEKFITQRDDEIKYNSGQTQ